MIFDRRTPEADLRKQLCCCCICKEVSVCTPSNDFYTTPVTGDRLVCDRCFRTNRHQDPRMSACR